MPSVKTDVEIAYRGSRDGDAEAIVAFLRECGYDPDERFWHWINRECPQGAAMVELALAGDRVVGHYAVLPRLLHVGGTTVKAGHAIHAAVHPQFRGLAILQGLMRRVVQTCQEAGLRLLYAFPNENIWLVYLKLFAWREIGDLVALECGLQDSEPADTDPPNVSWSDRIQFDARYQPFKRMEILQGKTYIMKDPAYLNWRYARHPRVRYQLLEAHTAAGELGGYAVLKLYEKHDVRYGHVVDLGVQLATLDMIPQLLSKALIVFRRQQVNRASCWLLNDTPFVDAARAMGFRATGFSTHVGYRLLDPHFPMSHLSLERWHLVMGDSDAF